MAAAKFFTEIAAKMSLKLHHKRLTINGYSCNKGLIARVTSTGKINSTRLRLVQLVSLPLLVTRAINPILHS